MTKTELEARVAELEAQLASGVPQGSFTQAELDAALAQSKAGFEDQIADLKKQLTQTLQRETSVAELADSLQKKLKAASVSAAAGDGVVLSGQKHDIIFQDSVLELIDAWRKKFVDETDIAIVVKRK